MMVSEYIFRTASKAISCTKEFYISTDKMDKNAEGLIFLSPSILALSNPMPSKDAFIHFSIHQKVQKLLVEEGLEVHHIAEYIQNINTLKYNYIGTCLVVYLLGNTALISAKRLQDYFYVGVYTFETAEDLLYYVQFCFKMLGFENSTDKLILCGEVAKDSQINRVISIYFSNLILDSKLSLEVLVES